MPCSFTSLRPQRNTHTLSLTLSAMAAYGTLLLLGLLGSLIMQLPLQRAAFLAGCPLDLNKSNFTPASAACSTDDKAKCCRYINSYIAVSLAHYAKRTGKLGVPPNFFLVCVQNISETIQRLGVSPNAKDFCGLGTKIPVNFTSSGQIPLTQMLQSLNIANVTENCKEPISEQTNCKKCITASISYLQNTTGALGKVAFSVFRDATFAALASQVEDALILANCFFNVQWIIMPPVSQSPPSSDTPEASPSPFIPARVKPNKYRHSYHLTLISGVGIVITAVALVMLVILVFLIRKKTKELKDFKNTDMASSKALTPAQSMLKYQEGAPMFRKFSYNEMRKATKNFRTIIGQGGFGTVYKAEFKDGFIAAVKRIDKFSEQGEDDFCREIELLARLHHRHLVALRGFCIKKKERFLIYEYMENGSLKDHLYSQGKDPLSWKERIQIAIDVANALEYLHFYCDPPLWHRDIKPSNILLDENLMAKVADFGLAHASNFGPICFEPVNNGIQGTPGYMDPEYVLTQELTEKSDLYSYGVLLLELVTARPAVKDGKNLVEWFMHSKSRLPELVDPKIRDSVDLCQLQNIVPIVRWCTQREGQARPSIKQVLRLLHESSGLHSEFLRMVDDEYEGNEREGRVCEGKVHRREASFLSWDGRGLAYSTDTSRSCCSRSVLLEMGSPQSPQSF